MTVQAADDPLLIILDNTSTKEAKRAALLQFAAEAWGRGWDECEETILEVLRMAGVPTEGVVLSSRSKARLS